jgi:hypothetical protein
MTRGLNVRRMLGPVNSVMGGEMSSSAGGGSGSSGITITNNVDGYLLKATGEADRVEGISALQYNSATTTLSSSANLYVSGSTHYLYLQGIDESGQPAKFKIAIEGSILSVSGSQS